MPSISEGLRGADRHLDLAIGRMSGISSSTWVGRRHWRQLQIVDEAMILTVNSFSLPKTREAYRYILTQTHTHYVVTTTTPNSSRYAGSEALLQQHSTRTDTSQQASESPFRLESSPKSSSPTNERSSHGSTSQSSSAVLPSACSTSETVLGR